eukprot:3563008-Prymnesium_polylepis.1
MAPAGSNCSRGPVPRPTSPPPVAPAAPSRVSPSSSTRSCAFALASSRRGPASWPAVAGPPRTASNR